jgi:hypothetical protein
LRNDRRVAIGRPDLDAREFRFAIFERERQLSLVKIAMVAPAHRDEVVFAIPAAVGEMLDVVIVQVAHRSTPRNATAIVIATTNGSPRCLGDMSGDLSVRVDPIAGALGRFDGARGDLEYLSSTVLERAVFALRWRNILGVEMRVPVCRDSSGSAVTLNRGCHPKNSGLIFSVAHCFFDNETPRG